MTLTKPQWLESVATRALDLLFPANCLACNTELGELGGSAHFCGDCRRQLSKSSWPTCRRCASRVPKIPGVVDDCPRCRGSKLYFDRSLALGVYEGLLRDLLLQMKTDRTQRLAHALGRWITDQLGDQLKSLRPDAIVPVPMHPWRRLARGTDAPASLAAVISEKLAISASRRLLSRRRNTQPQLGLSQPARFRNVHNQMRVRAGYSVDSQHILLVDDILTTGATCSEAAKMLKRAGAREVSVLVAARTPRD